MRKLVALLSLTALIMIPVGALAGDPSDINSDEKQETTRQTTEQTSTAPGFLGIHLQQVNGGLAEALNVSEDSGVLVRQVVDGSPADEAGLRAGDIVTRVDGKDVGTPAELRQVVRDQGAGDRVKVSFLRDGDRKSVNVTLGEAKDTLSMRGNQDRAPRKLGKAHRKFGKAERKMHEAGRKVRELRFQGEHGFLGVSTQPLSGDLAGYFGLEGDSGALVTQIVEDSPAAELGLKAGDVIVELGGEQIGSPSDLRKAVRSHDEVEDVKVVWVRDKKERNGTVELEMRSSGPHREWLGNLDLDLGDLDLGDLDLGDLDIQAHIDGITRHLSPHGDGDVRRRVQVHRFGNEDMNEAMDELREELQALKVELKKMQNEDD